MAIINTFKLCPSVPPCDLAIVYPSFQDPVAIKYASFMKHLQCLLERLGCPPASLPHIISATEAQLLLYRVAFHQMLSCIWGTGTLMHTKLILMSHFQFKAVCVKTMDTKIWSNDNDWEYSYDICVPVAHVTCRYCVDNMVILSCLIHVEHVPKTKHDNVFGLGHMFNMY